MINIFILVEGNKPFLLQFYGRPTLQQVIRQIGGVNEENAHLDISTKIGFGINDKLGDNEWLYFSKTTGNWVDFWKKNYLLKNQLKEIK